MSLAAVALEVSVGDREVLGRWARSGGVSARVARQARVLLSAADGVSNEEIARCCGVAPNTVRAWRRGFESGGLEWLGTVVGGRGPARSLDAGRVSAIVADTLFEQPPDGSSCWSTRSMAARHGVGKDVVARVWREHGLRPWRADVFKLSRDRDFEAKLADVVGLYLDPPEAAAVFAFDEKTQVQAMDRTQPSLPMVPGRNRTLTHDYKRHGTVDLFAALNVATGEVLHQTRKRHTGADVLAFFKQIDLHTPRRLEVHIVLDNLSAHKSKPVRDWLSHPEHARWHLHFTPTSASWANLVESWFSILTRKALKARTHTSVADLVDTIDTWTSHWNHNPKPLKWAKTAQPIIDKTRRAQTALNHANKPATHH